MTQDTSLTTTVEHPAPPAALSFTATLIWTIAVASLCAFATYKQGQKNLDEAIASRPRIAIVDVSAMATTWKVGATANERVSNGLMAAKLEAAKLAANGYIVLDRQHVLAAPKEITVDAP